MENINEHVYMYGRKLVYKQCTVRDTCPRMNSIIRPVCLRVGSSSVSKFILKITNFLVTGTKMGETVLDWQVRDHSVGLQDREVDVLLR